MNAANATTLEQGLLLAGQREWVADDSPLKVDEKGRRTGITWAEAADDVLIASTDRGHGGMNVYYFPQAHDDAIEYIEACARWARAYGHAIEQQSGGSWEEELGVVLPSGDPDKHIQTYKIRFASGNRIVALSSAPSRARGKQGIFVLDEAAFHPNLPGVLKAVMASLLRGGKVRVISTHNGEDNPFNELIAEIRAGRRKGTVHRYPFMRAVADGMYRRICEAEMAKREAAGLDPAPADWSQDKEDAYVADAYAFYGDDADEELDAVPKSGSGTYLSSSLIEARMRPVPILRLAYDDDFAHKPKHVRQSECQAWLDDHVAPLLHTLEPNLDHVFGQDFGRSGDLSVIAPADITATLKRRVKFLVELRNVPFEQQQQILWFIVDGLPNFRAGAMDARGNGSHLAELTWQKYGAGRIEAVMFTTEWYREHMPSFKAAFEDDDIEIPKDADVLKDLRSIKTDKGVSKIPDNYKGKGTDGKPRHGDAAVAIFLMDHATRIDAAPIEFQSTGVMRAGAFDDGNAGRGHQVIPDTGFGVVTGRNDFGGFV
ncbi:MAG TPA: hypothetical protein VFS30_09825 [Dehalococcoidia bacterium]|nr:hypothetical protein [Dehalococcoidia bacterium]